MASIYDQIDLRWTFRGDFLPGANGDLASSAEDQILALQDEILAVLQSAASDWREHQERGASLEDFLGEPNLKETGEKIRQQVFTALSMGSTLRARDLRVEVFPFDLHTILVILSIQAMATANNSLKADNLFRLISLFDFTEFGILPLNFVGSKEAIAT